MREKIFFQKFFTLACSRSLFTLSISALQKYFQKIFLIAEKKFIFFSWGSEMHRSIPPRPQNRMFARTHPRQKSFATANWTQRSATRVHLVLLEAQYSLRLPPQRFRRNFEHGSRQSGWRKNSPGLVVLKLTCQHVKNIYSITSILTISFWCEYAASPNTARH